MVKDSPLTPEEEQELVDRINANPLLHPDTPEIVLIKRHCYFPQNRPRVWWWKIVRPDGSIFADGFSSKREARDYLAERHLREGSSNG